MIATEQPRFVVIGVYGRFTMVDPIMWASTHSALATKDRVIQELEREIKALTGRDAA